MYRGRPPPRGGYPPPFESRGPRPPRPYPGPDYRDDRNRPRPPYHHEHGHSDSYRRSPPRRRYPSPGSGGPRGGEYWSGAPQRETSASPRGTIPLDHNLVITVGNELTSAPGAAPSSHHDRDFPARPENERSRGRSPDRARAKSRGRSKSRPRSQSRSPDRGRDKSRGRSKSRPQNQSRSPEQRSHSSSSSCSSRRGDHQYKKGFKELETARRRKELEDMLSLPTKSILKKRHDSGDSPSLQTVDSPRGHDSSNMSHMANQLLQAVRGLEPHMVASVLSELRSDPQMAQRAGLDAEIKEILNLLGAAGPGAKTPARTADDIDDEEKFLYGDSEEPKPPPASEPVRPHGLDLYVQVSNPAHPSGAEALEEYEKLQDLLKTIGLDLGVVEMTKMAARTKERLHGSNPPKTPTRRRRYSSGSSDAGQGRQRRSHSSSSSSSSRSCGSWSSEDRTRRNPGQNRTLRDTNETKVEMIATVPPPLHNEPLPQIQDPQSLVPHPGVPIPTYPPPQVHGMMPPNFPPPGYGQYGNYLPYMHQQWPPMYPPPSMSLPPQTAPDEFGVKLPPPDAEKINDRRVSEEQNNESQKQKVGIRSKVKGHHINPAAGTGSDWFCGCVQVLEERENLKQERDVRMKKKEFLMKELERLRKQQGELLRKKRREKEGHKDPLLQEISRLQEDVMTQISNLRREHEAAERKRNEIDKVALILGVSSADRPRRAARTQTLAAPSLSRASPDEPPAGAHPEAPPPEPFEYYDAGNHWCKNCNVTSGSMFDFFTHLHSKTHRKTLDPYERPWASAPAKIVKNIPPEEKLTKPAKGSEFLLPVRGFFCLLCRQFYGDAICAEEHVTAHAHNEKYKKQMYENPLYEQRRNLDRQAGLALDTSGKKRKHEDDEKGVKDKEEKPKHKKEKKEKKKEGDDASQEEKPKVKKEEEEEKPKRSKTGEDCKITKSLEEERPSYSKKDEGDNYKFSKKDDKHRYSKEEEERGERYKHREEHRYRYRRDDDDRYADRPKYGPRDTEDKYKFNKYSDSRSKYDRERDGGKPKAEKENYKKPELGKPAGKPELTKPEPPPKPYDPPKIYCGPSPAMRAKLRKQSLEAGKPAPMAPATTFGKFMWKKKENTLTKVAEKIAAEFIKDDEASASQQPASVEDSFAKSMAVAKEIAEKLGGNQQMDPPWASNGANRGRIRPNLPAPAAILRKTTTMGKPAPLNTFLSIRPPTKDFDSDGLTKALTPQNALLEGSTAHRPQASEAKPPLPVSRPAPHEVRPTPPGVKPEPPEVTPPPPGVRPAPPGVRPAPPGVKLAPPGVEPAPPVSAPVSSPSEAKPAVKPLSSGVAPPPSRAKPAQPTMVKIVSDVAAPGVPESEQTRTVFVKPPPFMNMSDRVQKSEKLKSNLATAKAQELLGIFYSGINQSGSSSITKPDSRADKSTTNKSPALQKPKQLPPVQTQTQSQPPTDVQTAPEPDPRADESTTNRSPLPAPQEPKPPPQPPAQTQTQSKPPTQVQTAPEPDPRADENTTNRSPLPAPQEPPPQPPAQTQSHPPTNVQTAPQPDLTSSPPSPQSQPTSDIQIASVWSLNCEPAPTFSLTTQPEPLPSAQCFPQNIPPQTETAEPEPISEDLSHPGTYSDKTPEPEIKPSHKIRGKKTPPCPPPRPANSIPNQIPDQAAAASV
uniref:Zinc finger protein 318 n=1 Tax=Scophthalmus maximus TaxID=52904 RepID=A0A8D3DZC9_SCOMX